MLSIQMNQVGEPDVLKLTNLSLPSIGENAVAIQLAFAGVNPADSYIRQGGYKFFSPTLPYTPGFDGAGIITETGENVTHFKPGDRVFVAATLAPYHTGTYAEQMICHVDGVRHLPQQVSFEEGASLGIPGTAAFRALYQRGNLQKEDVVLIHGASGGVGTLALQMAKQTGAFVIGTAGTKEGMAKVKQNGADLVFNHNEDHYLDKIPPVDLVLEMLANVNLEKDLELINRYGRIVVIGNRGSLDFNPRLAMEKEADILGMAVWNASEADYLNSLNAIEKLLANGVLKPEIGAIYPLSKAAQAQYDSLHTSGIGKVLLKMD